MRRALALAVSALAALLIAAAPAGAHPLGNFSVNHEAIVSVSADRIDVTYLLDQAEIPTFQERGLAPGAVIARKRGEVDRRLHLVVDGRTVALTSAAAPSIAFPPGQGGLHTTHVRIPLVARVRHARRVELRDGTFPGRVGWRAVVARPGAGTDVRSTAPSNDPTGGLRRYPRDALRSPLDVRTARLDARPGNGSLTAPRTPGGAFEKQGGRSEDGFAGLFANAASGRGVLVLLLLAALGWGALHALSPGHGKTMVAAYLVGTRGRPRHAVALGAVVTVTHTIGVFALGGVTLALSQYVLPEQLYPWLTLASGLLVLVVGAGVLRSRLKARNAHAHAHSHHHHHHDHDHDVGWGSVLAMGASAGLLPCPSALVVLLAAISQHQVALGLVLILAFSLGLALTLTALGLAVVWARRLPARVRVPARLATTLPALSAAVIVAVGVVLTVQAVPGLT
ncbi:MAG: nickel/cobalt transporter (NicO) family protein [Thermoleophilaceae bacterium]|nr:nickel/cobalt transporter (NicO) family protein [Thermoleophilaceae bacterium]